MSIKIVALADSPNLTTGFGNVANQIYKGFVEAGFELSVVGAMDYSYPETSTDLGFEFYPAVEYFDPFGLSVLCNLINSKQPDIVWLMFDLGNIKAIIKELETRTNFGTYKLVIYPPVEGTPVSPEFIRTIKKVINNNGHVVFWNNSALAAVLEMTPLKEGSYSVIPFGLDHAPFRQYPEHVRANLKRLVGFNNKIVVGTVGTNKRTKGLVDVMRVASRIRDRGYDNFIYYLHTSTEDRLAGGVDLKAQAEYLGVDDIVFFKPISNKKFTGSIHKGIERETFSEKELLQKLENGEKVKTPETPMERAALFSQLGYISRMNLLDIYLDMSQVEGWGLPIGEAMACGVPVIMPNDDFCREELYGDACYSVAPLHRMFWDVWHTGAWLLKMNVDHVADAVIDLAESKELQSMLSDVGQLNVQKFKWYKTQKAMNDLILELEGIGENDGENS